MAELSAAQREEIVKDIEQRWSNIWDVVAFSRQDLSAAVAAMDSFFDSNAATINNAYPAGFKANATTAQKARLLTLVVAKRYEVT